MRVSMKMVLAAACAAALMPAALAAQAPPPAAQVSSPDAQARLARARRLVTLTNPTEPYLDANMRGWEAGIKGAMAADPAMSSLEAAYPGAAQAGIDAARPLARESCLRFVIEETELKAKMLAERLTAAELEDTIAFFASSTGRKLVAGMLRNMDPSAVARDALARREESGEVAIETEAVRRMERDAARATMGDLTADDHVAMLKFQRNPAAAKYQAVAMEADNHALERARRPDPDWMRRQNEAVSSAVLAFVEAHRKS